MPEEPTDISDPVKKEKYKDDYAQCPNKISGPTKRALEEDGFDAANAFHRHLENFFNDPNCPPIVPVEKLDKGSCFDNLGPTPYSAGIRGQIQDYKNGLDPNSTAAENAQKILDGDWNDATGEVTMNC